MASYDPTTDNGRYDPREDLNYQPGYNVQDYIRNMMMRGRAEPMGAELPDFTYPNKVPNPVQMEDLQVDPYERYIPDGLQENDMGMNPQDFIGRQLAGDVVPMVRPGPYQPPTPKIYSQGARGMDAIQNFQSLGGQHQPDLMSIYNILTGREVGR